MWEYMYQISRFFSVGFNFFALTLTGLPLRFDFISRAYSHTDHETARRYGRSGDWARVIRVSRPKGWEGLGS